METVHLDTAINVPRGRELLAKLRESDNGNGVVSDTVDELERILSQQLLSGASNHSRTTASRAPVSSAIATSTPTIRVGAAIGCFTRLGTDTDSESLSGAAASSTVPQALSFTLATPTSATVASSVSALSPTSHDALDARISGSQAAKATSIEEKAFKYHRYMDELKKFLVETAQKHQNIDGRYTRDARNGRYEFTEVSGMLYMAQIIYDKDAAIDREFLARMEKMLVLRVEVASSFDKSSQGLNAAMADNNSRHYCFNQRVDDVMVVLRLLPVKKS